MKIVIGLGNPGKKFERTRHNVGFRIVNEFSRKNNFLDFKLSKKFWSEISEGFLKEKIILVSPQTFMNNSGKAVKLLTKYYTLDSKNLIVVHDDADLPLGKIRISVGHSSAGHKGVESIIKELKTKNFVRFRIGIKPKKTEKIKQKTEKFVLENFTKDEEKILKEVIEKTVEGVGMIIKFGLEKAMNKYNQ